MKLQPADTPVSAADREFIEELKGIIEKSLSAPDFGVDELCKKLYMSHTTLYRKVQALSGETPRQFIRSYRLKRAAEMLKDGSAKVGDAAFATGFSSTSYFIRCFKKAFGRLPSEY